jgi:hypothetical protein
VLQSLISIPCYLHIHPLDRERHLTPEVLSPGAEPEKTALLGAKRCSCSWGSRGDCGHGPSGQDGHHLAPSFSL